MTIDTLRLKICLLGQFAVGKTSLIRRFVHGTFSEDYISTIGTVVKRKSLDEIDEYAVDLLIWDLIGSDVVTDVRPNYLIGSHGGLIVCDLTRPETIQQLPEWAEYLFSITGLIPILFLANKTDLLSTSKLDQQASKLEYIANQFSTEAIFTSAKTGEHVEAAFHRLGELLVERAKRNTR